MHAQQQAPAPAVVFGQTHRLGMPQFDQCKFGGDKNPFNSTSKSATSNSPTLAHMAYFTRCGYRNALRNVCGAGAAVWPGEARDQKMGPTVRRVAHGSERSPANAGNSLAAVLR